MTNEPDVRDTTRLLNLAQAARSMNVNRRTLYYWMAAGMPFTSSAFGRRFVAIGDLQEWARIFQRGAAIRGLTYRKAATS